ncbi:DsbA family protein [Bartonella sp. CB178]|uniref:DsbA family protein n=1 Tax=Bartonella sp. CB178 TaxID=3112255 RepID=UPI00300E512C
MVDGRSFISSAIIFVLTVTAQIGPAASSSAGPKPVAVVDMGKVLQSRKVKDKVEGEENAPVTIVEYASLTCSHCGYFYNGVLPKIREKYIKTGKVRFIFRDFAFDPRATAGFMLAECVPADRYFPLIEVLFQRQQEWAWGRDALTPLRKIGFMAGLTEEGFNACLSNQSILDEINASFERGKALGVTVTPTFFINGNKYEGAMAAESFFSVIDSFL